MDRFEAMSAFVKAVETGSLSAAARALGLSLASVSRHVAALEERLGTRLLVRTTRRLAPSEEGRLYYERAKRILGEVEESEGALLARAAVPFGRLHVSAPALLGRLHVAPLLPAFLARYPRVSLDLTLFDRPVDLIEDGIDLAIRIGQLDDSSLIVRKLGSIHMVVCGAPEYLERRGEPQTLADLADHDCLVFTPLPGAAEWRFHGAGGTVVVRVPARIRANTLDVVVTAAFGGAGLVRAPSWQVAEHVAAGRLRVVLREYERPPSPVHALFSHTRLLSPKVRAFTDFLAERWTERGFVGPLGSSATERRSA